MSYEYVIVVLWDVGVYLMFGIVAEVLDDVVRWIICLEKIDIGIWLEIVGIVYWLGMLIISIMLCGYIEIFK